MASTRPWAFSIYEKFQENVGGNFHQVKNVFHLTQVRSPSSDCDFTRQNFKNVAVNSLEVVRPLKSCKWNTHFHRKVSNGKTGLPFQTSRLFRKFSNGTNQKRVFHLHPNRNFRNFLVNGKRPFFHGVFLKETDVMFTPGTFATATVISF